jgi:hypothetical protein
MENKNEVKENVEIIQTIELKDDEVSQKSEKKLSKIKQKAPSKKLSVTELAKYFKGNRIERRKQANRYKKSR